MPIQSKTEPAKIYAGEWQTPGRGMLEGKRLNTGITLLRYVTDVIGEGRGNIYSKATGKWYR
jgi:hypothetical protein